MGESNKRKKSKEERIQVSVRSPEGQNQSTPCSLRASACLFGVPLFDPPPGHVWPSSPASCPVWRTEILEVSGLAGGAKIWHTNRAVQSCQGLGHHKTQAGRRAFKAYIDAL